MPPTQCVISRKTHSWVLQYSSRLHFTFSGSKVQGTLTRCRRESNQNTRQPTAQELVSNLSGLLSSALTEGTRRSYQRARVVFRQFYAQFYGSSNPTLPLSPVCLPLYISYLSFRKLAYSTITLHLSAISYAHKLGGFCDPTKSFLIQKLLTALSRQRHADIRLPITRLVLHELVRSLEYTNSSAFQRTLFSAMFLTAFYGLFRIGELSTKSTRLACSVVQYRDLQILSREGDPCTAKITITDYKHNSDHRPFDILITRDDSVTFCPVKILLKYCKIRGNRPGPLFCNSDQTPITTSQFNTELQRCLQYCGLDISRYKNHSFRIGGACHAADKGFSDAQIRALGRWKSDAFKVYLRSESINAN